MAERKSEENSRRLRETSNSVRRRNRKPTTACREDRGSKTFSTLYFDCNIRRRGGATQGEWRATREKGCSGKQSANHPAIQPVGQPRSRESQRRVRRPRERPSASLPWAHVAAPRAPLAYGRIDRDRDRVVNESVRMISSRVPWMLDRRSGWWCD